MALAFNGSTGYLEWNKGGGSFPLSGLPITIVAFAAETGLTGNQEFIACLQQAAGSNAAYINGDSGNNNVQATMNGTAAVKTASLSSSSFSLLVGVFASTTSRSMYVASASSPGTDATSVTDNISTLDRITIGAAHNASLAARLFFQGSIAEVHIYSGALSSANVTSLLGGAAPESLANWVDGWTLNDTSTLTSIGGTRTLTLVGGVTNSGLAHPVTRSSFSGAVTLDDLSPSGSFTTVASGFTGAVTLDDLAPNGSFGPTPGTIASDPLTTNNGSVLALAALNYVCFYDQSTGALVLRKTGISTDSSGIFTVTDPALRPGTSYRVDWEVATTLQRRMPLRAAA